MHLVESTVAMQFELDPDRPRWRRIVSPTRKALGDNPDAIYFEAAVNPKYEYRVTGNLAGAVYTSFTVEAGAVEGKYSTRTTGVINDTQIDVAADGGYAIRSAARHPTATAGLPDDPPRSSRATTSRSRSRPPPTRTRSSRSRSRPSSRSDPPRRGTTTPSPPA